MLYLESLLVAFWNLSTSWLVLQVRWICDKYKRGYLRKRTNTIKGNKNLHISRKFSFKSLESCLSRCLRSCHYRRHLVCLANLPEKTAGYNCAHSYTFLATDPDLFSVMEPTSGKNANFWTVLEWEWWYIFQ